MMRQPEIASKPIITLTLNPTIDLACRSNEIRPIRKTPCDRRAHRRGGRRPKRRARAEGAWRRGGEFETLTHRMFEAAEELAEAGTSFVSNGAVENLAVTMGRHGALLAYRSGTLRLSGPKVRPVSGHDCRARPRTRCQDAFMLGMAAGAAAVLTPGTQLCQREDVERLYAEVMAERARMQST